MPFPFDQPFIDALLDNLLKDLPELLFPKTLGSEVRDGGIIRHIVIDGKSQEVFIAIVHSSVFDYLSI